MNVLMVTGAYHPEISSGGLQAALMARELRDRLNVRVLTTAVDPALPGRATVDGVEVTRVAVRIGSAWSQLRASLRLTLALCRLVSWCDVIHVHGVSKKNVFVAIVAKLLGRPTVLSLHTMGADAPEPVRRSGASQWWAFRSPARYLAVSPALRQAMLDAGTPETRVELVPNGIDADRFRPSDVEERRRLRVVEELDAAVPVIVFVGFFSHDKQPRMLFDAWLRLRDEHALDATLCFIGATKSEYFEVDASIADDMRRDAAGRQLDGRLRFTGAIPDVERYLRLADVFVLPSRREGLPVALMEAMACAVPCVATRLPGATDVLIADGVSGRLVPVGDDRACAAAIAEILRDPARAAAMGRAARQVIVERFTSPAIAKRWLHTYEAVAGATAAGRTA